MLAPHYNLTFGGEHPPSATLRNVIARAVQSHSRTVESVPLVPAVVTDDQQRQDQDAPSRTIVHEATQPESKPRSRSNRAVTASITRRTRTVLRWSGGMTRKASVCATTVGVRRTSAAFP